MIHDSWAPRMSEEPALPTHRSRLRSMMIEITAIAIVPHAVVALFPYFEAVSHHWSFCLRQAEFSSQCATAYHLVAMKYPPDALVPGVTVRRTQRGPVIAATGRTASQMAIYHATRARLFHQAKWRPWAGAPVEPPWPSL